MTAWGTTSPWAMTIPLRVRPARNARPRSALFLFITYILILLLCKAAPRSERCGEMVRSPG
ncbi:hypothetical protein D3C77_687380 [compost metagenome]